MDFNLAQTSASQEGQAPTPFFLSDRGQELIINGGGAIISLGLFALIIHKATLFVKAVKND